MAAGTAVGELRNLDDEALTVKLREAKEELFNLRFQGATGQLENHGRLKAVKRDIARIYTVLRERELGIRPEAAAAVEEAPAEKKAKKSKKAEPAEAAETPAVEDDAK